MGSDWKVVALGSNQFSVRPSYLVLMPFALFCNSRYVATAVTSVHEMENGFNIWSFNGKLLYRILKDHFFQVTILPCVVCKKKPK